MRALHFIGVVDSKYFNLGVVKIQPFLLFSNGAILHNLELNHPPLFEYRHPSSFQKWPGCLQVRANLAPFGIFSVSDLVFHFSYRHLFQKFLENFQFLDLICINYHYIEDQVAYNLYIYGHTKFKSSKKFSKYKRDLQCSIHLQPLLQFSYRHLYYKKSKVSVSEHFGCLQVKGGGCLNSRLCSIEMNTKQLKNEKRNQVNQFHSNMGRPSVIDSRNARNFDRFN
ncbi:Hypothetical_protein [Hexamita inflata]|uniref:Hypothetical_protein n=1 Tax=Hexamita inflata TaxID=28002 RepID=A0AA86UA71_9EUKA|nr:Hypothetical protein HINF_LOCUS37185 [Hexamita inflata]